MIKNINNEFIEACKQGNLDKVKFLLLVGDERGKADIHARVEKDVLNYMVKDSQGNFHTPPQFELELMKGPFDTGVHDACKNGHLKIVDFLLTSKELNEHANIRAYNDGLLGVAVKEKHYDIAKYLLLSNKLKMKANINGCYAYALSKAISNRDWDFAKWLLTAPELEERANISGKDNHWLGPLKRPKKRKNVQVIIPAPKLNCDSVFAWACFNVDLEAIKFLMQFPELHSYRALKKQRTKHGLYVDEILERVITSEYINKDGIVEVIDYLVNVVGGKFPKYKSFLLTRELIKEIYEKKTFHDNLVNDLQESYKIKRNKI